MFILGRKVFNIKHGRGNNVFPLIMYLLILTQQNWKSGNMSDFSTIKFHYTLQSVYKVSLNTEKERKKERKNETGREKKGFLSQADKLFMEGARGDWRKVNLNIYI